MSDILSSDMSNNVFVEKFKHLLLLKKFISNINSNEIQLNNNNNNNNTFYSRKSKNENNKNNMNE